MHVLVIKSHTLPFSISSLNSTQPFQIIFSDVQTSLIVSLDGFKYYVIFIDHFTKYIWFYPLKRKYEVQKVFIRYQAIVENYFSHKIITFYSDNRGEYMTLKDYPSFYDISHLTTPPHTPQHNGYSERLHCHIVETSLTLLSHASLPITYQPQAFAVVVYLISILPTSTLNFSFPYELIFHKSLNYSKLKVLNDYITFGFAPICLTNLVNDLHRVFIGYFLSQSAYLCLNPFTLKIYVCRHVQFVETVFPYISLYNTLPRPTSTTLNTWIPPILTVYIPTSSQQTDYTPSAISFQELPLPETISQPTVSSSQQEAPENHPSPNSSHQTTKQ